MIKKKERGGGEMIKIGLFLYKVNSFYENWKCDFTCDS